MITSRSIDDLLPIVALKCREFIRKCDEEGIDILVYSTYRDLEAQRKLYESGRSSAGKIVTNAEPGESFHNWRCAFDFVPIRNGKAMWNDKKTFLECGRIAESCGLEWAGRWKPVRVQGRLKHFSEMGHCQYTFGYTFHDFMAGNVDYSNFNA